MKKWYSQFNKQNTKQSKYRQYNIQITWHPEEFFLENTKLQFKENTERKKKTDTKSKKEKNYENKKYR